MIFFFFLKKEKRRGRNSFLFEQQKSKICLFTYPEVHLMFKLVFFLHKNSYLHAFSRSPGIPFA